MSEVPTGKELRVEKATPYASQVMNDSTYPGKYVDDALDGVQTTIGCRLRTVVEDLDLVLVGKDEKSAALGGSASDYWVPSFAVVKLKSTTGSAPATPAQISIGTASAGTQVIGATALTGLNTVGGTFMISFTGAKVAITANSTIYVKVTTVEGTATTAVADIYVYGEIL
jgi:hypothetical protein